MKCPYCENSKFSGHIKAYHKLREKIYEKIKECYNPQGILCPEAMDDLKLLKSLLENDKKGQFIDRSVNPITGEGYDFVVGVGGERELK